MAAAAHAPAAGHRVPVGIGVYLGVVQLLLALGWVVYAIYLPQLARAAGLPPTAVPWLLMADQLVFLVTDLAVGLASDRAARVLGRLGRAMVAATLVSTAAFLALPSVASLGSPAALVAVSLLWAITSSALRAPPLTLLGRYVARPSQPALLALHALGLGVAGAVSPYLGLVLQGVDPRLPFLLSALALAAVTLGMVAAERALARSPGGAASPVPAAPLPIPRAAVLFLAGCAVGALAFQWHAFVASAPLALRVVAAAELPWVLPAFWVGFNVALAPAAWSARRRGPWPTLLAGAVLAAAGTAAANTATSLAALVPAQIVAGAGWGTLLFSAFGGALALGHGGREGLMGGALQAALAAAALMRIAFVAAQWLPPGAAVQWGWVAALGFAAAALLVWPVRQRSGA